MIPLLYSGAMAGLGRGVEGEGEREIGRAGIEIKVVARMQVGQVLVEFQRAGGLDGQRRRAGHVDLKLSGDPAEGERAQIELGGGRRIEVEVDQVLGGNAVAAL